MMRQDRGATLRRLKRGSQMLKRSAAALLAAALPLAACNNQPSVSVQNASVGEVASKVAEAHGSGNFVNPGKWVSNVAVEEMSIPGMPPQAAAQMKAMTGRAHVTQSCLTPEQVKQPKADFFGTAEKNCRYDHFTMAGGKIDAALTCTREGTTQNMQMAGTYSPDAYSMVMTMSSSGAGPMSGMKMRSHVEAKRVGPCDGKEE
jgi:hypothetical protein